MGMKDDGGEGERDSDDRGTFSPDICILVPLPDLIHMSKERQVLVWRC